MPWLVCHGKYGVALGVDDLDGSVAHHHAARVEVAVAEREAIEGVEGVAEVLG